LGYIAEVPDGCAYQVKHADSIAQVIAV
jgi:hypothetical protein